MNNATSSTSVWVYIILVIVVIVLLALWLMRRRRAAEQQRQREQEQLRQQREQQRRLNALIDECYAASRRLDSLRAYQRRCGGCISGDTGLLAVCRRVRDSLAEADDSRRARSIEKAANFVLNMATARGLSHGGAWHMPAPVDAPADRQSYVERLGNDLSEASLTKRREALRAELAAEEGNTRMSDALAEWLEAAGNFGALADDTGASPEAITAGARAFLNVSSKIIDKYGFEL